MSWDGDRYQRRFDALAEAGVDIHGEAAFVVARRPSSVLDAGCGTGRVARELARRGVEVVGVDRDPSMIDTARRLSPELTWIIEDIPDLELGRRFDVVLMAGNVPLFTPEETRAALVAGCARHVADGGLLIAGFSLDRGYGLDEYDLHCEQAGLVPAGRWANWDGDPYVEGGDYAVSAHRRGPTSSTS
ncbi:MAG: class I SAM-dependent methyltransferase [Acidimicrobiales bacterium]